MPRVIRVKGKESEVKIPTGPKTRTVDDILKEVEVNGIGAAAANLSDEELTALIDVGAASDTQAKALAKRVVAIKGMLLIDATKDRWKSRAGNSGVAKVGKSTTTVMGTTKEFVALLKRENKLELFNQLTGIKVGDAKKILGDDALKEDGFMTLETIEFGSISLKLL